jgi:hypothetical protein
MPALVFEVVAVVDAGPPLAVLPVPLLPPPHPARITAPTATPPPTRNLRLLISSAILFPPHPPVQLFAAS